MKYLHVVSIFPALTETFVARELTMMHHLGCEVIIGQLRPVGHRPTASGFDSLRPFVIHARLLSASTIAGLIFFAVTRPTYLVRYVRLVLRVCPDIRSLLKLVYILLVSIDLAYRLRHVGIEHIHGHHLHSEAAGAMFIAGFLGVDYSFKVYTVKVYYPLEFIAEVIRNAKFIVADTLQVSTFLSHMGGNPNGIYVIRNAIALNESPQRREEPVMDPPVILAVGRLDHKKGFEILIDACSKLSAECVQFRCVIVGNGDEWTSLWNKKLRLGLENQVEMVGQLNFSEVVRWYEGAMVLTVPSVVSADGATDGLPTVVIEAFARGVPVVASTTAGIPEIIQHGINGFLVQPGSAQELADRIKEILSNKELRHTFVVNARRTAEQQFDLSRNARTFLTIMLSNCRKGSGRSLSHQGYAQMTVPENN